MKIAYDRDHDLLYIWMDEKRKSARTETISPGVHADFDEEDTLVGIEVIDARDTLGDTLELEMDLGSVDLRKLA